MRDNEKDDRRISRIVAFSLFILTLNSGIIQLLFKGHAEVTGYYRILILVSFWYGLGAVLKRRLLLSIGMLITGGIVFVAQGLLYPENKEYLLPVAVSFFVLSFPFFIYVSSINDYEIFRQILNKYIPVYTLHNIVCLGIRFIDANSQYSMSFGFYALLPSCLMFYEYTHSKKRCYLFLGGLNALCILLAGSRGPILWLAMYVFFLFVVQGRFTFGKVAVMMFLLAGGCFFQDLCAELYEMFFSMGIDSRTLYILGNKLTHASGRVELYETCFSTIMNNPFVGTGIASDRIIHSYAHNLFLELWMDFGLLLGTFILLSLAGMIYLVMSTGGTHVPLLPIYFFCGFMPLMFSGSYLSSISFWIFMGMVVNVGFLQKKRLRLRY